MKSVIDGVPSPSRSFGRSQSRRLKNCSVNRMTRSGTLAALVAQPPSSLEHSGLHGLRHLVPGSDLACVNSVGALLRCHTIHVGRADDPSWLAHGSIVLTDCTLTSDPATSAASDHPTESHHAPSSSAVSPRGLTRITASQRIKSGGGIVSADGVQPRSAVTVKKHGPSPSPTRPTTISSRQRPCRRTSRWPSLSKQLMACGVQSSGTVTVIKRGPSADQLTQPSRPPPPGHWRSESCPKSRTETFKTTIEVGMNSS